MRWLRCLLPALWLCLLLPAQRPKTAADAIARLAAAQDRPEAERLRAIGEVGDFADDDATQALLAELPRAKGQALRQAVVRALGEHPRRGATTALAELLAQSEAARFCEAIAAALAKQGDEGVAALVAALDRETVGSARRSAICDGLGAASGDAARDALLAALQRSGKRDRLPPLRALQRYHDDAKVDASREALAADGDPLVAATALLQLADHAHPAAFAKALELSRRRGSDPGADLHTAILAGLLTKPSVDTMPDLIAAATRAEAPFGPARAAGWAAAGQDAAVVRWWLEAGMARKPANERAVVARALGHAGEASHAAAAAGLAKALLGKDGEVVRAAAMALVRLGATHAAAPLQQLLQHGAAPMQPIAAGALQTLLGPDPAWREQLFAATEAKGAPLRAAALQLLAQSPPEAADRAVAVAAKNLAQPEWPVRSAAIALLVAVRAAAGVPLLFERIEPETARLRADVVAALQDLTGLQFATVAEWRSWWRREGATFQPRPSRQERQRDRARGGTAALYWNLPVVSERVVFVVDVSGSMLQPFGTGDDTRLDEAKRQLSLVLAKLPPKAKANLVAFSHDSRGFAPTLVTLDDGKRKAADAFAKALVGKGPTNVHAGLELAFADPEVDTIFLLTDGQPSAGPVVEEAALLAEVAAWNLGRGVRIHTVALGGKSRLLERLAEQSGGEHTVAR